MRHPAAARPSFTSLVRLIVVLSAGMLAACAGAPAPTVTPQPTATAEPRTLGLAVSRLANPFFASMQAGAEDAAARAGATVITVDAADDADVQAGQIADLIAQGVDALLINPVDSDAIIPAIEAANAAGIPVFTLDRSAGGGEVTAHIASDNAAGGRMAGEYLAEALGNTGSVVELEGTAGTSAARDRGAGFNAAMAGHPGITVIVRESASFSRAEAETLFAQILADNPQIDGVFAHNDDMILGAIAAATAAGREGIRFVGFDAVEDALTALEAGDLLATIAQQPAEMGRLGVETALTVLGGGTVPASIPVDLALITR